MLIEEILKMDNQDLRVQMRVIEMESDLGLLTLDRFSNHIRKNSDNSEDRDAESEAKLLLATQKVSEFEEVFKTGKFSSTDLMVLAGFFDVMGSRIDELTEERRLLLNELSKRAKQEELIKVTL